jgi:hypothetical protein
MTGGNEPVLELARAIRPYLPELLGEHAAEVDRKLANLLAAAGRGAAVASAVLECLRERDATHGWGAAFLETGLPPDVAGLGTVWRHYDPLPGEGAPVLVDKYACPAGDYVWYRRSRGQSPPACPTHGRTLVLVQDRSAPQ